MAFRRILRDTLEQMIEATRPIAPEYVSEETAPRRRRQQEPAQEEQTTPRPRRVAATPVQQRIRAVNREEIVATLSTPEGIRRALVIREILGPPKALQEEP